MKWLTLKLYDYPAVIEETSHVSFLFKQLVQTIEKTNNKEAMKELISLQEQIHIRITEIKEFAERFSFDSRISYFLKAKRNLAKILSNYSINSDKNLDYENSRLDNRQNKQNISNSKIRSQSAVGNINTNYSNNTYTNRINGNKQLTFNQINDSKVSNNSNVNSNGKKLKAISQEKHYYGNEPSNFVYKSNPKYGDKLELIGEKSEFSNMKVNHVPYDEDNDFNKWREIVFKIKLTTDEYNLLLEEKKNKKNNTLNTNQTNSKQIVKTNQLSKTNK
jgi:hypothetical protein